MLFLVFGKFIPWNWESLVTEAPGLRRPSSKKSAGEEVGFLKTSRPLGQCPGEVMVDDWSTNNSLIEKK